MMRFASIAVGIEVDGMKFSEKIVVSVIALNILFSVGCLAVCWHGMQSIDALVVGWFAFTTTELWGLSKIKREKIRKDDNND